MTEDQKLANLRSVSVDPHAGDPEDRRFLPADHVDRNVRHVYVSGGTAKVEGLVEQLRAEFGVPVKVINPLQKVEIDSKKFDVGYVDEIAPRMSVAVGLALRSYD